MALAEIDLSEHKFAPRCEKCDQPASIIAQGCMDKQPVVMCEACFDRGIELVKTVVKLYQRFNKKVLICGDCHRPIINLSTHIEVRRLP